MAPGCVFCEIVAGRSPAAEVLRDEHVVAFLDHTPLFPGHTLVVPVDHHVTITDLPPALIAPFFAQVQRVAAAVQSGMEAAGCFIGMNNVVSQSVPHLHAHVVPRNRKDGLRGFFWPRSRYGSESEMEATAVRVRDALAALPVLGGDATPGGT